MLRSALRVRRLKARWRLMRRGSYVLHLLRPLLALAFLLLVFVFCLVALKNRVAAATAS
jgi:hypothetical protein